MTGICLYAAPGRNRNDGSKRLRCDRSPRWVSFTGRTIRSAGVILTGLVLPVLFYLPVDAREDSARLVFEKPAAPGKTISYVVKKGDSLSAILRKQRGDEKKRVPYDVIRRLNPEIKDLNRIYPGQKILLPIRETAEQGESPNGLPKKEIPPPSPAPLPPEMKPVEKEHPGTAAIAPPRVEPVLEFIRPVIHRMKGTITARGNYYIPLKDAAQITIDCSLIPVVELDDGATVLLDFGNRLSESVKEMIVQSWTNVDVVPGEELGSALAGLKGIIRRSRNYAMTEAGSPLTLMQKPEIQVFPDWMIANKNSAVGASYRQGLFILGDNEKPLPGEARSFLEKNGLIVTEIAGGQTVTGPASRKATPVVADLRGFKGIGLAGQLLKAIGERPVANTEVVIFDHVRDGFTLSLTADLHLHRGGKQFIIQGKRLPDQFVRILKEGGAEVVPIGENTAGRPLIEDLLQGLQIPVPFGHYSFRVPETSGRPRLTATFSALRATFGDEPLYLLDFDMPPEILTLLRGLLGPRVVLY